jgi:hypothetical protein
VPWKDEPLHPQSDRKPKAATTPTNKIRTIPQLSSFRFRQVYLSDYLPELIDLFWPYCRLLFSNEAVTDQLPVTRPVSAASTFRPRNGNVQRPTRWGEEGRSVCNSAQKDS